MSEVLNIYQKLAKIRKAVEVVSKNASGFGYRYVTDDELLAKITGIMDKERVSLIPALVPGTFKVDPYKYARLNKKTSAWEDVYEVLVSAEMLFKWVNNDNPDDCVVVPWALTGQQGDASQSFGSGLTYAYRYFLLKYFGVATPNDDPDSWRSKQRAAADAEDKAIAASLIKVADGEVRAFLATNPDKAEDVKAFASKYVKNGNYQQITDSALAQKFLDSFREKFVPKE